MAKKEETEITDEWLQKYMPLVSEQMFRELEEQEEQAVWEESGSQFSERFEKNMEKFFRKVGRWEKFRNFAPLRTVAAACIVLCICLVGGGILHASGLIFFSVKKTPDTLNMTKYTYHTTEDVTEKPEWKKPGYIPKGYELVDEQEDVLGAVYIYKDKAEKELVCRQNLVSDGDSRSIDDEYDWKEEIETAYGTAYVQGYDNGFVYGYLEYMNCTFIVHAIDLDIREIEKIYNNWLC